MAKPRIPKEGDIFYIPNFYDNVLMWYRVLGVQRFAGDKTRAMVFFEYIGEEKYRHSSAVIKSLYYDIGERKFYVNIKAVPRGKVDNKEPLYIKEKSMLSSDVFKIVSSLVSAFTDSALGENTFDNVPP